MFYFCVYEKTAMIVLTGAVDRVAASPQNAIAVEHEAVVPAVQWENWKNRGGYRSMSRGGFCFTVVADNEWNQTTRSRQTKASLVWLVYTQVGWTCPSMVSRSFVGCDPSLLFFGTSSGIQATEYI